MGIKAEGLRSLLVILGMAAAALEARAQESKTSPPPALQWPALASSNAQGEIPVTLLRRLLEQGANDELCKLLMKRDQRPAPSENFVCPPEYKAKVNAREGQVSWAEGAKPTECGTNCVGRPSMSVTQLRDQPNQIYAMLFGNFTFSISSDLPVVNLKRKVTLFYEVQFYCRIKPGTREGSINVRLVFSPPAVNEPGLLEKIVDFALLPLNVSRKFEVAILRNLTTPDSQKFTLGSCNSIGAHKGESPDLDIIRYDMPSNKAGPIVRVTSIQTLRDESAIVRFRRIKRNPPTFGYTGPVEPGQFDLFLNGIQIPIPESTTQGLTTTGEGVALNYCTTIDMRGADLLQIIFINSHGGAVWSQFARSANFGAGPPRTMTSSRAVVVSVQSDLPGPGGPGSNKPRTLLLREYEFIYSIEYSPLLKALSTPADVTGGGRHLPPRAQPGQVSENVPVNLPPCQQIGPNPPADMHKEHIRNSTTPGASTNRSGLSLSAGGGIEGFTNGKFRDSTKDGGLWVVRGTLGTRSLFGLEASYIGSAQAIDSEATLVSNGIQGNLRLNLLRHIAVHPFLFAGIAWRRYNTTNITTNPATISDGDMWEIPMGLGLTLHYRRLLLDTRVELRASFKDNIVIITSDENGAKHRYSANATVGYEF